jgi:hypothetical protein
MNEVNLDGTINLVGARVFTERGRATSARWFVLEDGRTFHSRCFGHLIVSSHPAEYIATTDYLEEVLPN